MTDRRPRLNAPIAGAAGVGGLRAGHRRSLRRSIRVLVQSATVCACCAGLFDPAWANEASRRLLAEASQLIKAAPPQPIEALARLREATAADPKDAQAWMARGGYALTQFLPKEALDKAAALDPKLANLQFLRGRALQEAGRPGPALAAFKREANKDGNPAYYFYRALANKEARNYPAALADLDQSDRVLEEGRQATQLHRADIFALQGKTAAAEQAYRRVLTIDPQHPVVATAEARLKILSASAAGRRGASERPKR